MRSDNSTIATTNDNTDTMSFVDVTAETLGQNNDNNRTMNNDNFHPNPAEVLSATAIPQYDSIGVESEMTTTHVCINIKAKELMMIQSRDSDTPTGRAPVDIIVALDVSGSMEGSKLNLCKRTLEQLLPLLNHPQDRFGLVSYADTAQVVIPPQHLMTEPHKKQLAQTKIQALKANGSTNMSAAIGLATQELHALENPNPVRSIFLLTDGNANQGIADAAGLVELTRNCIAGEGIRESNHPSLTMSTVPGDSRIFSFFSRNNANAAEQHPDINESLAIPTEITTSTQSLPPVTMHCFGYGSDHDGKLLSKLAETAGGSYYFVQNDTSVATAFGDALGGIFSVVAQNVVLTLQAARSSSNFWTVVEVVNVLHKAALLRDNGAYTVNLGDFIAEEVRDVLVEIKLAQPTSSFAPNDHGPVPHLVASVAYTDTLGKCPARTNPVVVQIGRPMLSTIVSPANSHVTVQTLRISAVQAIQKAQKQAEFYHLVEARDTIRRMKQQLEVAQQDNSELHENPWIRMMLSDLHDVEQGLESQVSYEMMGMYDMVTRHAAFETQRCAESDESKLMKHANISNAKYDVVRSMKF